jgi:hypothetical protein
MNWNGVLMLVALKLAQVEMRIVAVFEYRTSSVTPAFPSSSHPPIDLINRRLHLEKFRQGRETAERYPDIFESELTRDDIRLSPNDGVKSITDLLFFANGMWDDLSNSPANHAHRMDFDQRAADITSNLDSWAYKFGVEIENQSMLCLYKPFGLNCCPHLPTIYPEMVNADLIEANKGFLARFSQEEFSAKSEDHSVQANENDKDDKFSQNVTIDKCIRLLKRRRQFASFLKMGLKSSEAVSANLGAHNLMNQLYLDIEDTLLRITTGQSYKKYSLQMLHSSNMLDLMIAFNITSPLSFASISNAFTNNVTRSKKDHTSDVDIEIPEVFGFEIHSIGYNYFLKATADGRPFPMNRHGSLMSSIFEVVRYFDSLNTFDYYMVCRHGYIQRVKRADIKNEKLNKYFLIMAIIVSVITVYKRVRERRSQTANPERPPIRKRDSKENRSQVNRPID